jgi:hypothetical protein
MSIASTRRRDAFRLACLFLLFLALLASRRRAQLDAPQVWCEEGSMVKAFLERGWSSIAEPLPLYLVLVPKLIVRAALAISVYHYPMIATLLTWLFTAFVALVIVRAPTQLAAKVLCAVAAFAVPSNPEVFGIASYTFWWASLCLFLLALWDVRRPLPIARLVLLALCGLSSPAIFIVLPALWFRAWKYRARWETVIAVAGSLVAAVQISFMNPAAKVRSSAWVLLENSIPKFCGRFVSGNLCDASWLLWIEGGVLVMLVAAYCFVERRRPTAWILGYLWFASIAAPLVRVNPRLLDPRGGGPRYFFFAFVLTAWILIQILMSERTRGLRTLAGIALFVSVVNALPVWSRTHDDLRWSEHVRSARLFARYDVPIQFDGDQWNAWSISASGETWNDLLRHDLTESMERIDARPTFAYRWVRDEHDAVAQPMMPVNATPARDGAFADGGSVLAHVGARWAVGPTLVFEMKRGDRLLYRSGESRTPHTMHVRGLEQRFIPRLPVTCEWRTLEFSNAELPDSFTLEIADDGDGTGEWAAE